MSCRQRGAVTQTRSLIGGECDEPCRTPLSLYAECQTRMSSLHVNRQSAAHCSFRPNSNQQRDVAVQCRYECLTFLVHSSSVGKSKRTHLGVFIEEWCKCSLQVPTALQQDGSADRVTLVEVVVLSHGSVQRVRQQTAAQLQMLAWHGAIIWRRLHQQAAAVICHSLNGSVWHTTTPTGTGTQQIMPLSRLLCDVPEIKISFCLLDSQKIYTVVQMDPNHIFK